MKSLEDFFHRAWLKYLKLTPDASGIWSLLTDRGEEIKNDHVAFRTFNIPGIDRKSIGRLFEERGYCEVEDLPFPEKKLQATYYVHPSGAYPKVFISELLLEEFADDLKNWVMSLVGNSLHYKMNSLESLLNPVWETCRFEDYSRFLSVSEYAAWTAAFGVQANHFTVFVNSLKTFDSLQELNGFLLKHGFRLNGAGGLVKGSPEELLEQSSTMARFIPWKFFDGTVKEVMGCYYEFARRYVIPGTNHFFQGFIPKSANRIFESTYQSRPLET